MTLFSLSLPTENAAQEAGAALSPFFRCGDVLTLSGPLGAGKTTFARAIIKALCGAADIPSPTYTLVEIYDAPDFALWHFDLYRLEKPDDIWELGFEDCLETGMAIIEWPERAAGLLPAQRLDFSFAMTAPARTLSAVGDEAWAARLAPFAADRTKTQ
ncbi:MAG: tRNA (adenosine(37)-N6)-threonylcarbamoyltransferase complex ATPase subunit type 1 TsaE [Pseudomonadota bacterium]